MKPIPLNPETEAVARRVVRFEEPAEALEDPIRFMAYAMKHATHEDMKTLRRYVSNEDFREALDKAPPGIIDPPHGLTGITKWAAIPLRRCQRALSGSNVSAATISRLAA
jgi:hypothetical protein